MSFRTKKIVAALEELEGTGAPVVEETVPATTPEVEAGAAEIAENVDEVQDLEVATEEAEGDVEALQDVQEIMEESVDEGTGMSEQTAEMAEVAVESICTRLGFPRGQKTLPSMESFGASGSRLASTKIALEGVGDRIKRAIAAIINYVKTLWEKIKGFFAGLFRSRAGLEKHLDALIKRAEGVDKAAKPKEAQLKIGAAKALSIGGKADKSTAKEILGESNELTMAAGEIASTIVSEVPKIEANSIEAVKAISGKLQGILKKFKPATVEGGEKDAAYYGHFVGGKAVGIVPVEKSEHGGFKVVMGAAEKPATEIAALTAPETVELLKEAKVVLKNLVKFEAVEKELQAAAKSAISHLEKLAKLAEKQASDDSAEGKKQTSAVSAMREVTSMSAKVGMTFPALVFQAVKAVADYGSASIGNLKAEAATPAAA